jgi:hypothetical protein
MLLNERSSLVTFSKCAELNLRPYIEPPKMSLSLLAEFDDLMRCTRILLDSSCEAGE